MLHGPLLKHVEGLDYEEMAQFLEAPEDAVRERVHRARERLCM